MRPYVVLLVITVAWNRAIHGEETIPSLQEANHENATNSSATAEKRVTRSDLGGQGESEENPPPFWANRGRSLNPSGQRLRRHETFFVEEPEWLVMREQQQIPEVEESDGHGECEESRKRRTSHLVGVDEAFWPSRGRRSGYNRPARQDQKVGKEAQDLSRLINMFHNPEEKFLTYKHPSRSHSELRGLMNMQSIEDPFWAARGRSLFLEPRVRRSGLTESLEEPFWAARGRRSGDSARVRRTEAFSGEEPFWAARGRRSEDPRGKRPESFSGEEPFWAARGRRSEDSKKSRRSEAYSGEEPFWAARGRRTENGVHEAISAKISSQSNRNRFEAVNPIRVVENKIASERPSPYKRDHLQFSSMEEPFWAARGKRGLIESPSAEEPFWAARGKKQLSQVNNYRWWPFPETAADNNAEDESFWNALEHKLLTRGSVYDTVPM